MKRGLKKAISVLLVLSLAAVPSLSFAAETDLDSLKKTARDTDYFTPVDHTELNYAEIPFEPVEVEPFVKEAEALRELCKDAANITEFETRMLDLASRYELAKGMYIISQLRSYIDGKNAENAETVARLTSEIALIDDAFKKMLHDALLSHCADAVKKYLTAGAVKQYAEYSDISDELPGLIEKESKLINEYNSKASDIMTVKYDGKSYTMNSAVDAYINGDIDYDTYFEIYKLIRKAQNEHLGDIFVRLVEVRNRIAALHGYSSYAEYAYKETYHRDYSPEDAQLFCNMIKRSSADLQRAFSMTNAMNTKGLTDLSYRGSELFAALIPCFAQLSDELLESATYIYEHKAYDDDISPNKVGTGASDNIRYYNMPFYYNNATGDINDLTTAIHELGHCNKFYWAGDHWNTFPMCIDTAEVHSQALELLMFRYYPELLGSEANNAEWFIVYHKVISDIIEGCLYDEFQRRVYETEDLTLKKTNMIFRDLCAEYGLITEDDERTELYQWADIPHNFNAPMYYISYATSVVGSFMFWQESREDYFKAVDDYLDFTSQPNELGFVDTFRAIGKESPMTEAAVDSVIKAIHDRYLHVLDMKDVDCYYWFAPEVYYVYTYGIMNGTAADSFSPFENVSREQSMTVLARIYGDGESYTLDQGVSWAVENGISDGEERMQGLTREQFITMLYRADQAQGDSRSEGSAESLSAFKDASHVSDWATAAMIWAVENSIINGIDDGILDPQGNIDRAHLAVVLARFCGQ